MGETKTKTLSDGTKLRVHFYGGEAGPREKDSVVIDGQSFKVGSKLDANRAVVAITDSKVQISDDTSGSRRHEKRTRWYTHNSKVLVAIKRRGDKEGR